MIELPRYRDIDQYLYMRGFRISEQRYASNEDIEEPVWKDGFKHYKVRYNYARQVGYKIDSIDLYGYVKTKNSRGPNNPPFVIYRMNVRTAEGYYYQLGSEDMMFWKDFLNRHMPDKRTRKPVIHPTTAIGTTDITSYNRRSMGIGRILRFPRRS